MPRLATPQDPTRPESIAADEIANTAAEPVPDPMGGGPGSVSSPQSHLGPNVFATASNRRIDVYESRDAAECRGVFMEIE